MTGNGAVIFRFYRGKPLQKQGRGFSLRELEEAKVDPVNARRLGIYVDFRRRTKHERNLKILKELFEKSAKKVAPAMVGAETR